MNYEKLWQESEPFEKRSLAQDPPPLGFFEDSPTLEFPKGFKQVGPQLFRGGIVHPSQLVSLTQHGVNLIVSLVPWYNLTEQPSAESFEGTQLHAPCVYRRDLTPDRIRLISYRISAHLAAGAKNSVYVHCLRGQVRTGMVIGGYTILHEGKNPLRACVESIPSFGLNLSSYKTLLNLL